MNKPETARLLINKLRELDKSYFEDEGKHLDVGMVLNVLEYTLAHTAPTYVSAAPSGAVCLTWKQGLSMKFAPGGEVHWAGKTEVMRPFGVGTPPENLFPFLHGEE